MKESLILVNNSKQSHYAKNYFKSEIFWQRIIKKLDRVNSTFFFQTQFLLKNKIMKNKRGLELVNSCS